MKVQRISVGENKGDQRDAFCPGFVWAVETAAKCPAKINYQWFYEETHYT